MSDKIFTFASSESCLGVEGKCLVSTCGPFSRVLRSDPERRLKVATRSGPGNFPGACLPETNTYIDGNINRERSLPLFPSSRPPVLPSPARSNTDRSRHEHPDLRSHYLQKSISGTAVLSYMFILCIIVHALYLLRSLHGLLRLFPSRPFPTNFRTNLKRNLLHYCVIIQGDAIHCLLM